MTKLFAHRGFTSNGNLAQNSIASLKNAYKAGFRAIEFDVWFFDKKLVLSHDEPKKQTSSQLPNLCDYFCFKNEIEYWIDFKNLNQKNIETALELAKTIIAEAEIELDKIYFAPFITDYKISQEILKITRKIFGDKMKFMAVCDKLENKNQIKALHEFLQKNEIKHLSIFHQLINENFMKIFCDVEIFAWTVNNEKRLRELEAFGVKNFATDLKLIEI